MMLEINLNFKNNNNYLKDINKLDFLICFGGWNNVKSITFNRKLKNPIIGINTVDLVFSKYSKRKY